MTLLRLSMLFLLATLNGPSADVTPTSKLDKKLSKYIAKMEARLIAKDKEDKERYATLLENLTAGNNDLRERLSKIEEQQRKQQDQQERYMEESKRISQCESARAYSSYKYRADHIKFKNCAANPYLTENGWIVFQRRVYGRVIFYRKWAEYKSGFGSSTGDFWMGLEPLHQITNSGTYELQVSLTYNGVTKYALYSSFRITNESDGYRLKLGKFVEGGAGDSLSAHNGVKFSTPDKDFSIPGNCARSFYSGWWFTTCFNTNLNGLFGVDGHGTGIIWKSHTSATKSASFSEMKIRRKK